MSKLQSLLFSIRRGDVLLPKLQSFLVKEQEMIEQGKTDRSAPVIRDAELTIKCFTERKATYNHGDPKTKDYFHPSQIGQCLRKLWFREMGAPVNGRATGEDMLKQHLIFEIGTYAHVMFQNLCARAGLLIQREVEVRDDVNKIIGHADGKLRIDAETPVLEFKTIGVRGFDKLDGPKKEHTWQAGIYTNVLNLPSMLFVYYDKDQGRLKEYKVVKDTKLFLGTLLPRIRSYTLAIKRRMIPEREGTNPNAFPCAWCEYSRICFGTSDLKNWALKAKVTLGKDTAHVPLLVFKTRK